MRGMTVLTSGSAHNFSAHPQSTNRKGECCRSTRLLTFDLALRLGLHAPVVLPRAAGPGVRDGGAADRGDRIAAGIPHRGLAVEEIADLLARQGLVFQQA